MDDSSPPPPTVQKMEPKHPGCGSCHLALVTSFGHRGAAGTRARPITGQPSITFHAVSKHEHDVPSANAEGAGFVTYAAASPQASRRPSFHPRTVCGGETER